MLTLVLLGLAIFLTLMFPEVILGMIVLVFAFAITAVTVIGIAIASFVMLIISTIFGWFGK